MLGFTIAVVPNPGTEVVRATIPLKPLMAFRRSVSVADWPAGRLRDEFEIDMAKSGGGGGNTTTVMDMDLVRVPLDPVTVTV
jgi:hypothetical protein